MNAQVAVGFSAQPNQVLDAYRKIEEAAKRANKELKSMKDIDFPGLDEARQQLEHINAGLAQMGSKLVRGSTAEAYRAGVRGGAYQGGDIVSVLRGMRAQYPDEAAYQREVKRLLHQAGNLANLSTLPAFAGAESGGMPGKGGGGGSALGGLASMMPMARIALGVLGVGTGVSAISKHLGLAEDEAVGVSDLRRGVRGLNEQFEDFRDNLRKAGEGLGVTFNESMRLSREYARISGVIGSDATATGTREGIGMARAFGMNPEAGISMMGRASWLGLGGGDPRKQAKLLAEAMEGSKLGARQYEAAEKLLAFAEKSAGIMGSGGNIEGYASRLAALFSHSDKGVRANAGNILVGLDDAIRAGGRTPAAHNLLYRLLHMNGISDPFQAEMSIAQGFGFVLPNGRMLGPEVLRYVRSRHGSNPYEMGSALQESFGIPGNIGMKVVQDLINGKNLSDPQLAAMVEERMKDLKASDPGERARQAAADLQNTLQDLLGTKLLPLATESKELLAQIAGGINSALDFMIPGYRRERERRENMAAWEPIAMKKASGAYVENAEHTPALFGHQIGDAQLAELKALNERRGIMTAMKSAAYKRYQAMLEAQYGLPAGTLHGIAMTESANGSRLVSNLGALGPYQFMPKTAEMMGVKNPMDPYESATGAARYLQQIKQRHPDWSLAEVLSAYHSGEGNVGNLGPQGRAYAPSVLKHMAGAGESSILLRSEVVIKDTKGTELAKVKMPDARIPPPSARRGQQ